jgi:GT2 family glycosyltransferase
LEEADLWAWAHEEDHEDTPPRGADRVTAIIVTHNGAPFIGKAVVELSRSEQRPGHIIVVNTGSKDATHRVLDQALSEELIDQVIAAPSDIGFSAAVNLAIDESEALPPLWYWLLHDDCWPRHDALTELLRAATVPDFATGPAIVLPKLLKPHRGNSPDRVSSVGETIARSGARIASVEPGEIDQRQDEAMPVLGGATAGMLVRADALEELGGLAEGLPYFRTGVELGWRAHRRGLQVETCPDAGVYHEQASWSGRRDSESAFDPEAHDLAAGMRVVQMHSSVPLLTGVRLRLVNRAHYIQAALAKDSDRTRLYSKAARAFSQTRSELPGLLALTAPIKRDSVRVPKGLLPGRFWGLGRFMQWSMGKVESWWRRLMGSTTGIGIDDLTSDETDSYRYQRTNISLVGVAAVLLALCTILAFRTLIGFGYPTSDSLLPPPATLGDAWDNWIKATPGLPGANAPWLGIMALGSTIAAGQPALFVWLLLLSSVLVAFTTAYHFLRRITPSNFALLLAAVWALLLPTSGLLRSGSLSGIVVAIMLPVLAIGLYEWTHVPLSGLAGLQPPGLVAVCGTLFAAVSPSLLLGVVAAGFVVAMFRRDFRGFLVITLMPLLVLGPWWPRVLADPARIFASVDGAANPADKLADVVSLLAARFGNSGPWWLTWGVLAVLAIAFLSAGRAQLASKWRRVLLIAMAASMLVGVALGRYVFYIGSVPVRGFSIPWVFGALLIALTLIALWLKSSNSTPSTKTRASNEIRSACVGLLAAYCALGTVWWVWAGAGEPLQLQTNDGLPGYVNAVEESWRASRTLVVTLDDGVAAVSVKDAKHPVWGSGESEALQPEALQTAYLELAQQIADGVITDRLAERLEQAGIAHVVVTGAPAPVILALQGVPGLTGALEVDGPVQTYVFTVAGTPSRVNIVTAGVQTPLERETVDTGPSYRRLLLLEQADPDWKLTVSGVPLTPVTDDSGLALFDLGAASGEVEWHLEPTWSWVIWELVAVVVLLWLAAPAARRNERSVRDSWKGEDDE